MQQPFLSPKLRRCHAGLDYMRQDTHTYGRGTDTRGLHYKQQQQKERQEKKLQKNHGRRTNRIKQVLKRMSYWHNNANTRTKRIYKGTKPPRNTNIRRVTTTHIYNTGIYRSKQSHDKRHPWQTSGIGHKHKNRTRGERYSHGRANERDTRTRYKCTTSENRDKRKGKKWFSWKEKEKLKGTAKEKHGPWRQA